MKKNKAFTLIELVVATSILTVAVFGIYKLISENNKAINNSNTTYNTYLLFPSIEACIDNLSLTDSNYISFGENLDECIISESSTTIDNIEYTFQALKIDEKEWEIVISSDFVGNLTGSYIQK